MTNHKEQKYVPALSFDFLTPLYDPVVAATTREKTFKRALVRQASPQPGQRLLDLGCGTATLTLALKQACPRADVFGLDGDARILRRARRKADRAEVEITLDTGMSFEMPYPDGHFDTVVSSLFFHHLTTDSKRRTLGEVHRVLKPGGFLHVADWGRPSGYVMRLASLPVQWLDGATSKDSYAGMLPSLVAEAGFSPAREKASFGTLFGTIRMIEAERA